MKWISPAGLAFFALPGTYAAPSEGLPLHLETRTALNSRVSNVHINRREPVEGLVTYTYGSCTSVASHEAHHTIGETTDASHDRLVWIVPEDVTSGGCISAWSRTTHRLVGRSDPQQFDFHAIERRGKLKRRSITMTPSNGIDPLGPWFDGVKLLKASNLSSVDAQAAKNKNIAIVGAGMSGLMTYLCLTQSGLKNVEIIEASNRLGGRVHTAYLSGGPFDYSYQEMGPMRFPNTITLNNQTYNVSDHQMVFQLAAEMNKLNSNNPKSKDLNVDFIPWLQSSANGLVLRDGIRLPSGMPPTVAQVASDPSLSIPRVIDAETQALAAKVQSALPGPDFFAKMAQNMFKAHREWIDGGLADGLPGDHWSEFAFMMNYLNGSLNSTNYLGGTSAMSFWDELYEGMYFSASTWKTIDGGLNRLPLSFTPLVSKSITFGRKIEEIRYSAKTKKIELLSKSTKTAKPGKKAEKDSTAHDFAIIALPFSILKKTRIAPALPPTIASAIATVPYTRACKVALEFRTRFWEDVKNVPGGPIYGSCSTNAADIPGIGSVCYPSYNLPLNATDTTITDSKETGKGKGPGQGPASMLGSYISGNQFGDTWESVPEQEHVDYVLDAIAEIHGEDLVRSQYTGKYSRVCWGLDPFQAGSWASPTVGMHELFIPEYFKTVRFSGNRSDNSGRGETGAGLVFVGEHTSYTHAWIASALESGIRGSVQVLLELGLVDEAKAVVDKWMGRWIDV